MINEEKTLVEFGYKSSELSHGSHKKVWVVCDDCGKERLVLFFSRTKLCRSCSMSGKNNHYYGKHLSEEHKRKIRDNLPDRSGEKHPWFGKHHTEESKLKISISKQNISEETKQKLKNVHLGKKHTEKSKLKMSKSHIGKFIGKNNPNWKGGISFVPYCSKFNNELKRYIRERDNNTCQLCNKSQDENSQKLTVHHIHYDKENCNPDLITLCKSCNSKVNFNRDYWEQYFMRLLFYNKHIKIYNMESELNIWNYGNL